MKKICIPFILLVLFTITPILQGCKTQDPFVDTPVYQNIILEKQDTIGFEWIDNTKPSQIEKKVQLNWKLSLKDERWQDWYCDNKSVWMLDKQGNLFQIDINTGKTVYHFTSQAWFATQLHDQSRLFMLARQEDDTIELQAYQPNKKSIAWTKSLEDKTAIFAGNKIMNGILFIGNQSGTLFALHAKDGSELWRLDTKQEIRSDIFFDGNTLYFNNVDSSCYAVDMINGKVLWKRQGVLTRKTTFPSEFRLFAHIDGKIGYFGNTFEPFTLVDATTGNVYWEYPYSSDAIQSYADTASKNLDVPNWDRSWPKWVISSFEKPFAVKDKLVLLFNSNFRQDLHVLDPSTKKVIWQKEEIEFCLKTDDDKMVVGRYELNKDRDRYTTMLEKLDPETGKVVWRNDKFSEVVKKEGINFDEAQIINKYILINESYGENLFLIDTTNGDLVWAYSSNDSSLNFANISVYDNVFFAEQLESNSLFCFQILN